MNYIYEKQQNSSPIFYWTRGVLVDEAAKQQLNNVARLPFIYKHLAVMPDVHVGKGATIGSVIATKGAIIPAACGVDIGCGMQAVKTTLKANDLPDDLSSLRSSIEEAVPHGRTHNGSLGDKGAWNNSNFPYEQEWLGLVSDYQRITHKHPGAYSSNSRLHLGTLGTGNHFIEICLDQNQDVWVMLHSGSRGCGNKIGSYFIEAAKEEMKKYFITSYLPDKDLAYLVEYTELFDDYMEAVSWAQDYAKVNRQCMMQATLKAMKSHLIPFDVTSTLVDCHHNYVEKEHHFGNNVLVTRKGAVRARHNDFGIIPGSMGTGSFIVRGKGNPNSFCSCSHGAGRVMIRNQAKLSISLEDHVLATQGIECRKDLDVIDESPAAYKPIEAVMKAQDDLVEVIWTLKQVLNVKG